MIRIKSVVPLEDYQLKLGFTDGTEKIIDFKPYLKGPVFEALKQDVNLWRAVRVDPELGTIVWPNGADFCPDMLYWSRPPASWEAGAKRTA